MREMFLIDPINKGDIEKIKYLVEKKGLLDKEDDRMNSWPITCAARTGNLEIVKYLFEKGVTIKGSNALHESCRSGKFEIIKYLIENGACVSREEIRLVLKYGHIDIVKYLLSIGSPFYIHNNERIEEIVQNCMEYRQELLPILVCTSYKFEHPSYMVLDYLEYIL